METLCVATAVLGLLAAGRKLIDALSGPDAAPPPRDEAAPINQVLREVRQCRSTIEVLYKTLALVEDGQLPYPHRAAWIGIDVLVAALSDTVLAISELQVLCEDLVEEQRGSGSPASSSRQGDIVSRLCSRLRWQNLSITMMMTVLKCRGEADAENSRSVLEQRISRLLTSNNDLSRRMQSMVRPVAQYYRQSESPPDYNTTRRSNGVIVNAPRLPDGSFRVEGRSIYSGFTLANVPSMPAVPLPVRIAELKDGEELYTFDFSRENSDELASPPASPPVSPPENADQPSSPPPRPRKKSKPLKKFWKLGRTKA